jgi:transposase
LAKDWTYHQLEASRLIEPNRDVRQGRPTPHTPLKASECQIDSHVRPNAEAMRHRMQVNACFVLGTHISASALSDPEVMAAYKGQARVEGGFRFLKDPLFFCLVVVC